MSKLIKSKVKKLLRKMMEESAINIASKYNLQYEVLELIKAGYSPNDALKEFDLL